MKTGDFFGHATSKLLVGGNPFTGHMYIPWVTGDEALDYHTGEKILEAFFRAEELGYNTLLLLTDDFTLRVIRQYRNMGGKMKWIAQTHPSMLLRANLASLMKYDPIAIFHQGTATDNLVEEGKIDELLGNIEMIKETGKPTGLSTHVPDVIQRAEKEAWGLNFYMASLHNLRKKRKYESSFITGKKIQHQFDMEDREIMFKTIRSTNKPCIAFKILAGGHLTRDYESLAGAFKETYENIKPHDFAVVGVIQKYKDQLKENAMIMEEIL